MSHSDHETRDLDVKKNLNSRRQVLVMILHKNEQMQQIHEAQLRINCQISSGLAAYYVMSVASEYKRDDVLYIEKSGLEPRPETPAFNDYVCVGHICKSF